MLLHLQLPLPLHTDRPDRGTALAFFLNPASQALVVSLLADVHSVAKARGKRSRVTDGGGRLGLLDLSDERARVRHVGHFAVDVGGLFDGKHRFVGAVLRGRSFGLGDFAPGAGWWGRLEREVVA